MVLGPVAVLVVLRSVPSLDLHGFDAEGHLVVVSLIAACALATAVVALGTAMRSGQPNVVWLGLGCVVVGVAMLGHGLTTPGVLGRPGNVWVARLPFVAMCGFAVCLAAAGRPVPRWADRLVRRRPRAAIVVASAAVAASVGAVTLRPTAFAGERVLAWEDDVLDVVSVASIALLVWSIRRHWRRWHLGHDVVQLALVLAAASSIAALVAFQHGRFGHLSWWDYHGYLLAGFGAAVYAVFRRRADERALGDILQQAFVDDPFAQIESGYPEALRSLVRAVEVKDPYTHGHSRRTARLAVELGLEMGLAPERLRVIARGAYLHDVGKIAIPDHILNKPGALTDEEWDVIRTHPRLGHDLEATAPSLHEALPVILHHHERVDGCGYPDGLAGGDIPLEARVVAVADVWDALTTDRAYRAGWPAVTALAHIRAGVGTHFDGRVVEALVRLLATTGVDVTTPAVGAAAVAWAAAETCHELDEPLVAA